MGRIRKLERALSRNAHSRLDKAEEQLRELRQFNARSPSGTLTIRTEQGEEIVVRYDNAEVCVAVAGGAGQMPQTCTLTREQWGRVVRGETGQWT